MKKFTIIMILALFSKIETMAKNNDQNGDSLHISIDKRTKTVITNSNSNAQGYSLLSDIREIFKAKNMVLADATWQSIREIVNSPSNKDTLIKIEQEGKFINIAFKKSDEALTTTNSNNTENRKREDNPNESVKIGWDGIHVKDGSDEVHISRRGVQVIENGNEEVNIGFGKDNDSTYHSNWQNRHDYGSLAGFNVYLGLNTLTGKPETNYNSDSYSLKPFGSRYVSFGWNKSTNLSNGVNARLKLALGINFSWYNFMLENNNIWTKGPTQIELIPSVQPLKKSKLTISYMDIPIVPYIAFKKGKFIDYFGFGGYLGYRLASHSKTKTENGNKKDHERNNFYLNNFRYGLTLQLGMNNFPDLFVNYDLNPLFKTNKGPNINGLSFGVRF